MSVVQAEQAAVVRVQAQMEAVRSRELQTQAAAVVVEVMAVMDSSPKLAVQVL
jgi:hypothetical protein